MSEVTLTLPDEVLARAEIMARRTGRPLSSLLADAIQASLQPLGPVNGEKEIEAWPDAEVLAATETELPPADDQQLSLLLDQQQRNPLTLEERSQLLALLAAYQEGLFRKARATREAVRRGLRPPPQP